MNTIPLGIKINIPVTAVTEIENWWSKLSDESKLELSDLYNHENQEEIETISIYLCADFVDEAIPDADTIFWMNHLYEYLINHEIIYESTKVHAGGICYQTKAAEKAIRAGLVEKDFKCPVKNCSCSMTKMISKKQQALKLYLRFET